jgi:hypothetical protein
MQNISQFKKISYWANLASILGLLISVGGLLISIGGFKITISDLNKLNNKIKDLNNKIYSLEQSKHLNTFKKVNQFRYRDILNNNMIKITGTYDDYIGDVQTSEAFAIVKNENTYLLQRAWGYKYNKWELHVNEKDLPEVFDVIICIAIDNGIKEMRAWRDKKVENKITGKMEPDYSGRVELPPYVYENSYFTVSIKK